MIGFDAWNAALNAVTHADTDTTEFDAGFPRRLEALTHEIVEMNIEPDELNHFAAMAASAMFAALQDAGEEQDGITMYESEQIAKAIMGGMRMGLVVGVKVGLSRGLEERFGT